VRNEREDLEPRRYNLDGLTKKGDRPLISTPRGKALGARPSKTGCRSRLRDGHGFGFVCGLAAWLSQSLCAESLSDRNSGYVLPWIGAVDRLKRAQARRGGNPRAGGGGSPLGGAWRDTARRWRSETRNETPGGEA
jgi:hypothetical protein